MYWSIDDQNSVFDHVNIKMDYLNFGWYIGMIAQKWILS